MFTKFFKQATQCFLEKNGIIYMAYRPRIYLSVICHMHTIAL